MTNLLNNFGVNQEALQDQATAQTGGGGKFVPPAKGRARARLFAVIELGKHIRNFQGDTKECDLIALGFELSGKNHPPREINGKEVPHTIWLELTKSSNVKARFYKLFTLMNYKQLAKHVCELLGGAYVVDIHHDEKEKRDAPGEKAVFAKIVDAAGNWTVAPPVYYNEEGEALPLTVAPLVNKPMLFLWGQPNKAQWDSIFIEGQGDNGKSRNKWQDLIKSAINYSGSPVEDMLLGLGDTSPMGKTSEQKPAAVSDDDVLADIGL